MERNFTPTNTPISKKWGLVSLGAALIFIMGCIVSCMKDQPEKINGERPLMGSGYGIHSATLVVKDLPEARTYYSEVLGFAKPMTDTFEKGLFDGTNSTSISFADMSSIELLSVDDSIKVTKLDAVIRRFLDRDEAIEMYSISSSAIDTTASWLASQGFKVDTQRSQYIANNYPKQSEWDEDRTQLLNLGLDSLNSSMHLPRFVQNTVFPYERMHEWNSFYNIQRGFVKHPNGVVGISALQIVVKDLDAGREEFKKMGLTELEDNPSKNLARFKIMRNQEVQLIAPQSDDDVYASALKTHGDGVFGLVFEVENLQATHDSLKVKLPQQALRFDSLPNRVTVLREYAHGVQLEFQQESREQAIMAEKLQLNFGSTLDTVAQQNAKSMYMKYCALCHGKNREGYAADFAPSLRSHSLMATSQQSNFLRYAIQYGRTGTAMAGYYKAVGGPLEYIEIELLLKWLQESSGLEAPIVLKSESVHGDITLGATVYANKCTACHGENGEGISAPALSNPLLLATASDAFLRYAVAEGRDSTLMPAFKDSLTDAELDGVTAFLRSRASGWNVPSRDSISMPSPENYVLNPKNNVPNFKLRENRYVSAEQVNKALKDSLRFVILDARSTVAWRQTHIPGAIPVPYYEEPEKFVGHIPNDSTWVVAYCACPHAASGNVINKLRRLGYKKTAILDEGILVWAQLGYPVLHGQ